MSVESEAVKRVPGRGVPSFLDLITNLMNRFPVTAISRPRQQVMREARLVCQTPADGILWVKGMLAMLASISSGKSVGILVPELTECVQTVRFSAATPRNTQPQVALPLGSASTGLQSTARSWLLRPGHNHQNLSQCSRFPLPEEKKMLLIFTYS